MFGLWFNIGSMLDDGVYDWYGEDGGDGVYGFDCFVVVGYVVYIDGFNFMR